MYQTIAEQCEDSTYNDRTLNYYKMSFNEAVAHKETEKQDVIISNLISLAFNTHHENEIIQEWKEYSTVSRPGADNIYEYNKLIYDGLLAIKESRWIDALLLFDKQIELVDGDSRHIRYLSMSYINKAKVYALAHNYVNAIASINHSMMIAEKYNIKDLRMETYRSLSDYYLLANEDDLSKQYRIRFLELKDSVFSFQQLKRISEQNFINQIKQYDQQIAEINQKRQIQAIAFWAIGVIALTILLFLIILFRKNRRLKERNQSLYNRINNMLQHDDEEHSQRMKYALSPQEPQEKTKYKNSNLDDADKRELLSQILNVMENCEEVYSPDFSMERLASLVNSTYKYVSQVINETYHSNFNAFINEYRVKEACRRMSDFTHFGNLTIEAISKSVGFKARSSFFIAFKNFTGLTPSEYMAIAKAKRQ